MTVDIYIYAEKHENGIWKSCNPVESFTEDGEVSYSMETVYENYNAYELAHILLNVDRMNNHGFDLNAQPRGLPDDLSPELKKMVSCWKEKGWNCNYPSWLLLRELLEFPWEQENIASTGFVNAEQYVILKEKGQPDHFVSTGGSRGVGGRSRKSRGSSIATYVFSFLTWLIPRIVTNEEMDQLVADGNLSSSAVTEITSYPPHAEHCQVFLQQTVPLLKTFGEPNEVRIVFWN